MQTAEAKTRYTPEEYLALEEQAEFKSEYHDGEIIPMAGGSFNHNEIITNFCGLKAILRQQGYHLFTNDVRVWIPKYQRFTYPDILVTRGESSHYQNRTDTLLNPSLIIEVLSKSIQDYDQGDKFKFYRSIPDLQEYLLINQYDLEEKQYTKTDSDFWMFRAYETAADTITLTSIDVELAVTTIYEGITFEPKQS